MLGPGDHVDGEHHDCESRSVDRERSAGGMVRTGVGRAANAVLGPGLCGCRWRTRRSAQPPRSSSTSSCAPGCAVPRRHPHCVRLPRSRRRARPRDQPLSAARAGATCRDGTRRCGARRERAGGSAQADHPGGRLAVWLLVAAWWSVSAGSTDAPSSSTAVGSCRNLVVATGSKLRSLPGVEIGGASSRPIRPCSSTNDRIGPGLAPTPQSALRRRPRERSTASRGPKARTRTGSCIQVCRRGCSTLRASVEELRRKRSSTSLCAASDPATASQG